MEIWPVLGILIFRRISWSSHAPPQGTQKQQFKFTSYRLSSQILKKVFLGPKGALKLDISCFPYARWCPLNLGYYLSHLRCQTFCSIIFHLSIWHSERRFIYSFIYLFIEMQYKVIRGTFGFKLFLILKIGKWRLRKWNVAFSPQTTPQLGFSWSVLVVWKLRWSWGSHGATQKWCRRRGLELQSHDFLQLLIYLEGWEHTENPPTPLQ